jgi:hypothetical protein
MLRCNIIGSVKHKELISILEVRPCFAKAIYVLVFKGIKRIISVTKIFISSILVLYKYIRFSIIFIL